MVDIYMLCVIYVFCFITWRKFWQEFHWNVESFRILFDYINSQSDKTRKKHSSFNSHSTRLEHKTKLLRRNVVSLKLKYVHDSRRLSTASTNRYERLLLLNRCWRHPNWARRRIRNHSTTQPLNYLWLHRGLFRMVFVASSSWRQNRRFNQVLQTQ